MERFQCTLGRPGAPWVALGFVMEQTLCLRKASVRLEKYFGRKSKRCSVDVNPEFQFEDKFIIPEQIAIRLINSTEISVEQFYKNILVHYQLKHKQHWRKKAIQNEETLKSVPKTTRHAATTTHVPTYPKPVNHIIQTFSKIREDDEDYTDMDILESSGQYTKI